MATLKMVLNKSQHQKKTKSNQSMIMLRYTHKKAVTYFYTQKNLEDKSWDEKYQQVKRNYSGSDRLNIYLTKFKQKVEDIVNNLLISGEEPTTGYVKSIYQSNKSETEKKKQYTFFEYAEIYLMNDKKIALGTRKSYRTVLNKLKDYEKYARVGLDWSSFDMEFYYDFFEYYTGIEGLTNNGFGKAIKNIKAIMNDATSNGFNTHLDYQHKNFKTIKEDVNNIYLSEEELQKIIDLDLSEQKNLDQVRDLFIFGCYTGLRYSDFSQVKPEHIHGEILRIKTQKTDEWVSIPLLSPVKVIMEKYKNQPNGLPKSCTNQTMNKYIKEIGELAKINDSELKIRNRGKERVEKIFNKFELICTHTARRSFATNMFKKGVPTRVIMKITGHRTEKAFNSYIKISQDENAELMLRYLKESA